MVKIVLSECLSEFAMASASGGLLCFFCMEKPSLNIGFDEGLQETFSNKAYLKSMWHFLGSSL